MALNVKHSTRLRNDLCTAAFNLQTGFNTTGEIRIYDSLPADADAVEPAGVHILVVLPLAATWATGAPVAGVLTAAAIPAATIANTGTALGFRIVLHADDGTADGTNKAFRRIQGTVGTSGCDMNLTPNALTATATETISSLTYTIEP